jgi:hypothetical protein
MQQPRGNGGIMCWHVLLIVAVAVAAGSAPVLLLLSHSQQPLGGGQSLLCVLDAMQEYVYPVRPNPVCKAQQLSGRVAQGWPEASQPASDVPTQCSDTWVGQLHRQERRVFSQNYEDGVTLAILEQLRPRDKFYVEFGTEDASESNTRVLREYHGWRGLLMDGGHANASINLHRTLIKEETIVAELERHHVPKGLGLLSVDIDSYDFWVLKAILQEGGYRPEVIIVEVNSQLGNTECLTLPPAAVTGRLLLEAVRISFRPVRLRTTCCCATVLGYELACVEYLSQGYINAGGSVPVFTALAAQHGYTVLYCESVGVNCFLVKTARLSDLMQSRSVSTHHCRS